MLFHHLLFVMREHRRFRRRRLQFDMTQDACYGFSDTVHHVLELGEGFGLVFVERVALPIGP